MSPTAALSSYQSTSQVTLRSKWVSAFRLLSASTQQTRFVVQPSLWTLASYQVLELFLVQFYSLSQLPFKAI